MIDNAKEPIIIRVKFQINQNPHGISPGSFIDVIIEIIDEFEMISSNNEKFTADLAALEKLKPSASGTIAKYMPKLRKTIIKFPGKNQAEIAKIVSNDIKHLPRG